MSIMLTQFDSSLFFTQLSLYIWFIEKRTTSFFFLLEKAYFLSYCDRFCFLIFVCLLSLPIFYYLVKIKPAYLTNQGYNPRNRVFIFKKNTCLWHLNIISYKKNIDPWCSAYPHLVITKTHLYINHFNMIALRHMTMFFFNEE
jgi:hypothetical protein